MAARKKATENGNRDKRKATTQPVGELRELLPYWDRSFELKNGYQSLVVEVIGRENNTLTFYILDGQGNPQRKAGTEPYTINLDDGMEVWSSLPSTAQDVDPESSQRTGYLFVTKAWLERNRVQGLLRGGGKWPTSVSL